MSKFKEPIDFETEKSRLGGDAAVGLATWTVVGAFGILASSILAVASKIGKNTSGLIASLTGLAVSGGLLGWVYFKDRVNQADRQELEKLEADYIASGKPFPTREEIHAARLAETAEDFKKSWQHKIQAEDKPQSLINSAGIYPL